MSAMQVKIFVNEAHVFNDAVVMFDVWPETQVNLPAERRGDVGMNTHDRNAVLGPENMPSTEAPKFAFWQNVPIAAADGVNANVLQVSNKGLLLAQSLWNELSETAGITIAR